MNSSRMSGNSLFALATSGISSNYYYLCNIQNATNGLTLDNILHPDVDKKTSMYNYMNSTFSQYLARNFNSIDMDRDGKINDTDIANYTQKINTTGLSYNQLCQLCSNGSSNSLLETVLEHFSEIDTNGDGRITSAEISAYGINKEADKIKDKYPKVDPSSMSIFYKTTPSTSRTADSDT